jgi:hypothetical protein
MTTNVPAPEMSSSSGAGHPQSVMERAKSALEGVTPGPWGVDLFPHYDLDDYERDNPGTLSEEELADRAIYSVTGPNWEQIARCSGDKNAEFIADAHTLVLELIAEVRTLTTKLAQAEAERDSWRAMSAGGGA